MRIDRLTVCVMLTVWLSASIGLSCAASDWPQFLGASRNGVSPEDALISQFPASGPRVLWKQELGVGMSGMAVVGDIVFTLFQDDQSQYVVALNASDGRILWKTVVAPTYENAMGNGPRATPTVHGEAVCTYTGEGILTVLDRASGRIEWSVDVPKALGGKATEYGNACSPLIVDKKVVVQANGRTGCVAAFKLNDGALEWKSGGGGSGGYSSPIVTELAGVRQIVAFVGNAALGIDPADGTELWRYAYVTDYDCNTATPVRLSDDDVLISSGENHGSTILNIKRSGKKLSATPAWESLSRESVLRAEWQTPVVAEGYLFGLDNVGSAGPITNLVCVRISDGRQMWIKTRFGKSNLTLADGKLFLTTMAGELVIVSADTEGFNETARHQLIGQTRQAPVIANGKLYLRDDEQIMCVDIRAK